MNENNHPELNEFRLRVLTEYEKGTAYRGLPADEAVALSLVPPGTGLYRDMSNIAPALPVLSKDACVGCMECVTACPDSALVATVVPESRADQGFAANYAKTTKYFEVPRKKGGEGGFFGLFVDPTKCKGCGECVEVCGEHKALTMVDKTPEVLAGARASFAHQRSLPATPDAYIQEKVLADMMLSEKAHLYVGGAGSCMGCGEATAIRMMLAATGFKYGKKSIGIVASTGCNSVFGATYPYNPYLVTWTNSLFEDAPAFSMGVRLRWDQQGLAGRKIWAVGGDGAMYDIGFQSLSRALTSGMDLKVLVLDTQVYSNTGGQASTATFVAQEAKMASFGRAGTGKVERRKELAQIAMMHPDVFVAQTTPAHVNHFYRAVMAANDYPGPAILVAYAACMPEHGIGDDQAAAAARLAVDSRAFPLFVYDPRAGEKMRERLSLQGNPSPKNDWAADPKTKEPVDFVTFARAEGRFSHHFGADGKPSEALLRGREERLKNWRLLQELAGLR
ncbi:MAG: 4Fe-4S binding protein [Deltaproteobacteria bacterium]|nr:4Fe-4S binding protein [Deltaproteobacteria bacterium]